MLQHWQTERELKDKLSEAEKRVIHLEDQNLRLKVMLIENGLCPYGGVKKGEPLGQCRFGFPGCGCADDLFAAETAGIIKSTHPGEEE